MTTSSVGFSSKTPPAYFQEARAEALGHWETLEREPLLAGPWRQLFRQVQSPRHVLSELLQNADDAGASTAAASISDGVFEFTHNGSDFTREQFHSLCRFGVSNKRNLHTIGFRGVGFKSTFSLGPQVEVLTPALAVRFNEARFTLPEWLNGPLREDGTCIRVRLRDDRREAELRANLDDWRSSPASLLFFSRIRSLEIDGQVIERRPQGPGPVPGSEWVSLSTNPDKRLLVAKSAPAPFPKEAVEEIRQERGSDDVELPPCQVELILGLPGPQRLFVVLPTGVEPHLPFSCNAPFVQDPARMVIKNPALSATNRWLLGCIGELLAHVMESWLGDESLSPAERAAAYDLLPQQAPLPGTIAGDATGIVRSTFRERLNDSPILLTEGGALVPANTCIAPPHDLYDVWTEEQIVATFGDECEHVLAKAVKDEQRRRLSQWDWLEMTRSETILQALGGSVRPPRPETWASLVALWRFVARNVGGDYAGIRRQRLMPLAIVPVLDSEVLVPASEVVRVADARRGMADEDWGFLTEDLTQLHPDWVSTLGERAEGDTAYAQCLSMLEDIGLHTPTPINRVIQQRASDFFQSEELEIADCVRFAHLLAAMGVPAPDDIEYVVSDTTRRAPKHGIYIDDGALAALVPSDWAEEHFLHPDYEVIGAQCTSEKWRDWSRSPESRLRIGSVIRSRITTFFSPDGVRTLCKERGLDLRHSFYAQHQSTMVSDFDFDDVILKHWSVQADEQPEVWGHALRHLLRSPAREWADTVYASITESNYSHSRRVPVHGLPAAWIHRFRRLPCLPDTHGRWHQPAALLVRTPDTEPLLGVEDFVDGDLDTESNRKLLLLLGARDTPAGVEPILERLRALAQTDEPPLTEVGRWYGALDRVLARGRPDDREAIREALEGESLIYTKSSGWVCLEEVFQRLGEHDPPDLPTIHPEFGDLPMWSTLGVEERPSPDLLVEHMTSVESGTKFDGSQLTRTRAILREHGARVWSECGHWLSLDGSWRPTEDFKYSLFDDEAVRVRELFPHVKRATADCRMLRAEGSAGVLLAELDDLAAQLRYRPRQVQGDLPPTEPRPWLLEFARLIARVRLEDDARQQAVRTVAARLARTRWQPSGALSVTPYLNGEPAGQPHQPDALWHGEMLFVREQSPARACDAVVSELARHFPSEPVQRAIRSCYERGAAFVADYLSGQFEFDAEGAESPDGRDAPVSQQSVAGSSEPIGTPAEGGAPSPDPALNAPTDAPDDAPDEDGSEPRGRPPKPHAPKPDPLIVRFAKAKGFRRGENDHIWVHSDGSTLRRTDDNIPWVHAHGDRVIQRYWVSEHRLAAGVDVPAEVWSALRRSPEWCSLVLVTDDRRPVALSGVSLLKMVQEERVGVFPAHYRLRKIAES